MDKLEEIVNKIDFSDKGSDPKLVSSHFCTEGNFEEEVVKNEPKRLCKILYFGENEMKPAPCGGEIAKVSVFDRDNIRLGGPPPTPIDEYGSCSKCKVRTDW